MDKTNFPFQKALADLFSYETRAGVINPFVGKAKSVRRRKHVAVISALAASLFPFEPFVRTCSKTSPLPASLFERRLFAFQYSKSEFRPRKTPLPFLQLTREILLLKIELRELPLRPLRDILLMEKLFDNFYQFNSISIIFRR